MYLAPIIRTRAPVSTARRRAVGAAVIPLSLVVMVPYLALYALYAGTMLAARGIAHAPRALLGVMDYAGTAVLGR